eukprot:SAG31_NODE_2101_length_6445_cov_16.552159_3_plen_51_part_00
MTMRVRCDRRQFRGLVVALGVALVARGGTLIEDMIFVNQIYCIRASAEAT